MIILEFIKYILFGMLSLVIIAFITLLSVTAYRSVQNYDLKKEEIKDYQAFQKDTEVIKGLVKEAKKEKHFIFPNTYNLVVKTNEGSKMLSVNEQQYRDYQAGSKIHFRIDKTDNNTIVRDLKHKSDIDTLKDYKKYNEDSPAKLFKSIED